MDVHTAIRTTRLLLAAAVLSCCQVSRADQVKVTVDPAHADRVLARMHMTNLLVLGAVALVAERTQDEDVEDYAERLRLDHSFIDRKVQAMATRLDVDLDAASDELEQELAQLGATPGGEEASPERLLALKQLRNEVAQLVHQGGPSVDRRFVEVMERAHEMEVHHLSAVRAGVDDELRGLLVRLQPILEQHVRLAWFLEENLNESTGGT